MKVPKMSAQLLSEDRTLKLGRFALSVLLVAGFMPISGCGDGDSSTGPQDEDPLHPVPCTFADPRCRERLALDGGLFFPLFRTHPLMERNPSVVHAVIVVHGTNRDADAYFETMVLATNQAGWIDSTLVISPNFKTEDDSPPADEPRWTSSGWKRGHLSQEAGISTTRVSSYAVVDEILRILGRADLYPALRTVVVTGHSAGGQYAHRFAAGSTVEDDLQRIRFRYLVANPSSWLYLGPERALSWSPLSFGLPAREECPGYNEWHYGLEELNSYMSRLTLEEIRSQLSSRDVVVAVGDQDTGSSLLDVSCAANLQGQHRYERGLTLAAYMDWAFPYNGHHLHVVPGVAHSSRSIYTSEVGMGILFGW